MARSTAAIAAAEPGWFLFVTVALIGGGAVAVLRLEPRRQIMALGAMAVALTLLLPVARRDARLHCIIGIAPQPVRVVEGLLWSSPLIGLAAMRSLRDSAVIASVVVATAFLSVGASRNTKSRVAHRVVPGIPASLPEWTVGLRRSAPILVVALAAGIVGSGTPGYVMLVLPALGLTTVPIGTSSV